MYTISLLTDNKKESNKMMGYADYAVEDEEFNRSQILVSDASAIGATGISPISNDEDLSSSSSQQYSNIQCMLIEEVRKYQCIWNTTCRSFKETPKKAEAWRRVSVAMKMEGKFF